MAAAAAVRKAPTKAKVKVRSTRRERKEDDGQLLNKYLRSMGTIPLLSGEDEAAKAIDALDDIASRLLVIRERTIKAVKSSARSVDRGTPYRATSRRQRLARQEQLL